MFLRHDYKRNVSLKSSKFVNILIEHLFKYILILKCQVDKERFVLQYFELFVRLKTCFVLKVYPKMVVKQNKVMKAKGLNNFCKWTRTWLNDVLKTRILHQHGKWLEYQTYFCSTLDVAKLYASEPIVLVLFPIGKDIPMYLLQLRFLDSNYKTVYLFFFNQCHYGQGCCKLCDGYLP